MFDLHLHTTASDGTYTPGQLVQMAADKGFTTIAITDHDTMDGVAEAVDKGGRCNVEVFSGVEISAGIDLEIHMLGYGMHPGHPAIAALLEELRLAREERLEAMLVKLQKLGMDITKEEVRTKAGGVIGRPHIARVMIDHGVVPDVRTAFQQYIGLGAKAYVARRKIPTVRVIEIIRASGGVPVLAHAGLLRLGEVQLRQWLDVLRGQGLMGLECYHSAHTPQMEHFLRGEASRLSLLVTGGSDFHGVTRKEIELGEGLQRWRDKQACLTELRKAIHSLH